MEKRWCKFCEKYVPAEALHAGVADQLSGPSSAPITTDLEMQLARAEQERVRVLIAIRDRLLASLARQSDVVTASREDHARVDGVVTALRTDLEVQLHRVTELEAIVERLRARVAELVELRGRGEREIQALRCERKQLKEERDALQAELAHADCLLQGDSLADERDEATRERDALRKGFASLVQALESIPAAVAQAQAALAPRPVTGVDLEE